jgi:hypothetical protein
MSTPAEWTLYRCEVDGRWLRDPASDPWAPPDVPRWTKLARFALEFDTPEKAVAAHPGATARPFKRNTYGWTTEIEP